MPSKVAHARAVLSDGSEKRPIGFLCLEAKKFNRNNMCFGAFAGTKNRLLLVYFF